jgi:hypothetical protein
MCEIDEKCVFDEHCSKSEETKTECFIEKYGKK